MENKLKTIINGIKILIDSKFAENKADWSQRDKSAYNYIKNKPFDVDDKGKVIKKLDEKFLPSSVVLNSAGIKVANNGEIFNDYNNNIASGYYSHAEGAQTTASGQNSHTEGFDTKANGNYSHAEGLGTNADGSCSHVEGRYTKTVRDYSHAEGYGTNAEGLYSHTEGNNTTASGTASHAEGDNTTTIGHYSHAEGIGTRAIGDKSHAEGSNTTAGKIASHAEGDGTIAGGIASHAEGCNTNANSNYSHAEGGYTKVSDFDYSPTVLLTASKGEYSHAEGYGSVARGAISHAEGNGTKADGDYSHSEGKGTIASGENQHVQGKYNVQDSNSKYAHIVGNGESDSKRSNAHTVDWDGNAWYQGNVFVGGTNDTNASKLATETYADNAANKVKNDLLNGAGDAYDTLQELGVLIDDNKDALDALREVATNKADSEHTHSWNELENKPFGDEENLLYSADIQFVKSDNNSDVYAILSDFDSSKYSISNTYIIKVNDCTFTGEWTGVYYNTYRIEAYNENNDYVNLYYQSNYVSLTFLKSEWSENAELIPETYNAHITISSSELKTINTKYISDNIPKIQTANVGQFISVKSVDENGKPTEWECVDNAPDWDTLTNKPFYSYNGYKTIIPEQTLIIETSEALNTNGFNEALTIGKTYHITLNGVNYDCVVRDFRGDSFIGNGQMIGGDGEPSNGEPFSCISYNTGIMWLTVAEPGEYTFSLSEPVTMYKTLDNEFLSSEVAICNKAQEGQFICVKSVDENGKPIEWECVDNAPDWSVIKNRPFYDEHEKYIVNGTFTMTPDPSYGEGYYDINDCQGSFNDLIRGQLYKIRIDDVILECNCVSIYRDFVIGFDYTDLEDNRLYLYIEDGNNNYGIQFKPNASIYSEYESRNVKFQISTVVPQKQLDSKYLPSEVAVCNQAEVGQFISVKSVDENGKPIEWECVDNVPLLIVKEINGKSSHSAEEIYKANQDGKNVIYLDNERVYYLSYTESEPSYYASFSNCYLPYIHTVDINGYDISHTDTWIGDTKELTTDADSIVDAINELNEKLETKQPVESTALILSSPNGTRFSITIGDDGVLSATEIE